ncbi:unnamed protein product [Bursaphelenchus okinawaensis]|uniref:Reverse transcriptase domain-containing protein n=1 Tax=Bursaphelenchus okinawaensis TaxID=465554 RepID=A0A811KBT3_9BILA|nr:unnamed protein product [Bursaphelenchus okinawaensis]CAG9098369.1 unnamed protein product [Bursaphelenchus okinawaensis]
MEKTDAKHEDIWKALEEAGADHKTIKMIRILYQNAKSYVQIGKEKAEYEVYRGVRQGDVMSPTIFNLVMQMALNQIAWSGGIELEDGKRRLTHLLYADDLILMANDVAEAETNLEKVEKKLREMELELNKKKTKWMGSTGIDRDQSLGLGGESIERVAAFIYLRNPESEVGARARMAWSTFQRWREVLTSPRTRLRLKRKFYMTCLLPTITYGAECWSLTVKARWKLIRTVRKMERMMLGITWRDKRRSAEIRRRTGLKSASLVATEKKWNCAWKMLTAQDERWIKKIIMWIPPPRQETRW